MQGFASKRRGKSYWKYSTADATGVWATEYRNEEKQVKWNEIFNDVDVLNLKKWHVLFYFIATET